MTEHVERRLHAVARKRTNQRRQLRQMQRALASARQTGQQLWNSNVQLRKQLREMTEAKALATWAAPPDLGETSVHAVRFSLFARLKQRWFGWRAASSDTSGGRYSDMTGLR